MTAFTVKSVPTFRDMQGRFAKAEKALLDERRKQMRSLGRLHVEAIRKFAPKKTGEFARGIQFRTKQTGDEVSFSVSTPQPLGKWLRPPGTKPHVIRAKRAKYLRFYWPKVGKVVYFTAVNHPGYRPKNDFVKQGVDSLENERGIALRKISTRYISEITK